MPSKRTSVGRPGPANTCAGVNRSNSVRSSSTMSAPLPASASGFPIRSTPTTSPKPPDRPACTPEIASSKTIACDGATPSNSAALRYVSGDGLPARPQRRASTPVTRTSKRSNRPARSSIAVQFSLADTTASRLPAARSASSSCTVSAKTSTPLVASSCGEVAVLPVAQPAARQTVRGIVRRPLGQADPPGAPGTPRPRRSAADRPHGPGSHDRCRRARRSRPRASPTRPGTRRTAASTPPRAGWRSG